MWEKIILLTFINNRTPIINVSFALTRVGLKIPYHHYILNWFQICEGHGCEQNDKNPSSEHPSQVLVYKKSSDHLTKQPTSTRGSQMHNA